MLLICPVPGNKWLSGSEIKVASRLLTFTVITRSFLHDLFCSCSHFWLPKHWVVWAAQLSCAFLEKVFSFAGFKSDKWILWAAHPCIPHHLSTLLVISLIHFYCPVLQVLSLSQSGSNLTLLITFVTSPCSFSVSCVPHFLCISYSNNSDNLSPSEYWSVDNTNFFISSPKTGTSQHYLVSNDI